MYYDHLHDLRLGTDNGALAAHFITSCDYFAPSLSKASGGREGSRDMDKRASKKRIYREHVTVTHQHAEPCSALGCQCLVDSIWINGCHSTMRDERW